MKFVIENLARFLLAIIVSALVLISINTFLIPIVRDFLPSSFSGEQSYVNHSDVSSGPVVSILNATVTIPRNGAADLFNPANFTVHSSSGEDLMTQLISDFGKADYRDREHVFVYRINDDRTNTLVSTIDTSKAGEWVVIYMVTDSGGSSSLKVFYTVI